MNKNVINCAALLTIHSVLSNADRIKNNDEYFTNLHNALYNVIVEFAKYLKEDDIENIKKKIYEIERAILPCGTQVTENMLLNMIDQIIQDIYYSIPANKKMSNDKNKAIQTLLKFIYNDEQFKVIVVEELDKAENFNKIIFEILNKNNNNNYGKLKCYKVK